MSKLSQLIDLKAQLRTRISETPDPDQRAALEHALAGVEAKISGDRKARMAARRLRTTPDGSERDHRQFDP